MPLVLTSGPAAESLSLTEAKAHLRVDAADEDTLIASLILAARMHVERALDMALITQSWSLYFDRWPDAAWVEIPLAPVQSVSAVRLYAANDSATVMDPALYQADTLSKRARLARRGGLSWPGPGRPANGIEIAFTAGYGAAAASVPGSIRQAILLLIAHWYEEREPVTFDAAEMVPLTVASLLGPYRTAHL